ncbi:MAG: chemotaxis response regulator protein-glutamate methylesterase, partial [Candidatus Omnitrophota bacterium]
NKALEEILRLKPDVVTLDVNLPDISGLEVLKEIMEKFPTRVLMLSAYTQKGSDATIKALELGALDFIPKPSGEVSLDLYNFKDQIINKIKLAYQIDIAKILRIREKKGLREDLDIKKIVVVGASTGGPKAIIEIMSNLSSKVDATFLIIQHMPAGFTKSFAQRLSWYAPFKIKEAEEEILRKRSGYVAPSGFHMIIEKRSKFYYIRLDETKLVNYLRPSVDVAMKSVAENFEGEIIGVILTGMGKDGLEGARAIKKKGGKIIAQDESSCIVYGMPKAVIEENLADYVLPLSEISKKIEECIG